MAPNAGTDPRFGRVIDRLQAAGGAFDITHTKTGKTPIAIDEADLAKVSGGVIQGTSGNDSLEGGSTRMDVIFAGNGNDRIDGGPGDKIGDFVYGEGGDDTLIWAPRDGGDLFFAGEGSDTLEIQAVSMPDLLAAIVISSPGLEMRVEDNILRCVDASGNPASFTGTVSIGDVRMVFSDIERIRLVGS